MEWNGKHIFFLNMLSFIIQGAVFVKYIILTSWRPLIHTDNHSVHLLHWVITKIIWRKKTPQSYYQYISNEEDDVISWAELSTPDASNILCVNTSGHPNTTHTHTPPHHERRCARGRDMQTNKHTCARKHTHMLFIMGLSVFTHTHTQVWQCAFVRSHLAPVVFIVQFISQHAEGRWRGLWKALSLQRTTGKQRDAPPSGVSAYI